MRKQIKTNTIKYWLYWKLTFLRDKNIPTFLVRFIDYIRDLLWDIYDYEN